MAYTDQTISAQQRMRRRKALLRSFLLRGVAKRPELLANPGPFTSTTGWTAHFTSTLSLEGDELRVTNDVGSSSQGRMVIGFSTVPGRTYTATLTRSADAMQNTNAALDLSNNANGSSAFASTDAAIGGSASLEFTATQATTYLSYRMGSTADGEYVQLARASVK